MATKKKAPKKAARRAAAPRKSIALVNERIILALESIAASLEKMANPVLTVSADPTAPAAATAAAVAAVTEVAAAKPVRARIAYNIPTDEDLLS